MMVKEEMVRKGVENADDSPLANYAVSKEPKPHVESKDEGIADAIEGVKKPENDFETRLAQLTKKSAEVHSLQQQAEERFRKAQELEAKFAEMEAKLNERAEMDKLKDTNKFEYLKKQGLNLDDIIQDTLKATKDPDTSDVYRELQDTKSSVKWLQDYIKGIEETKKKADLQREEEQKKAAYESQLNTIKEDVKKIVTPDKFELLYKHDLVDDAINSWLQQKAEDGSPPDIDSYFGEFETALEQEARKTLDSWRQTKKLSSIFSSSDTPQDATPKDIFQARKIEPTLTNKITATPTPELPQKRLSEEERRKQFAAAVEQMWRK